MTQTTAALKSSSASRIAFIRAGWHGDIVGQALEGFQVEMGQLGCASDQIDVFDAPGAFEIPLQAQTLARTGRYGAVIGAALVVDGGIYRHEFVAETVVGALMQVQLQTETPMISVVLTPHHFHSHETHRQFYLDHFLEKGAEAARACMAAMSTLAKIRRLSRGEAPLKAAANL
jgi:6,7-dimethyl-8-ribityllumazine synthase